METILITGANGQLGKAFQLLAKKYNNFNYIFTSKDTLDITNEEEIEVFLKNNSVNYIINCAAYTAVDKAENDKENAYLINALATKNLAEISSKFNIPFIHFSTDYVFDGSVNSPRLETDLTNPIGSYGQTKLDGENFALFANPKTLIIRTSWVYSRYGNNFVKTMLRLFKEKDEINVINDQLGSPTNAVDLADAVLTILSNQKLEYGIFNYSNEGECSWFDFAYRIKELKHSSIKINPIPTSAYPTPAKRPAFSLLDKSKIKDIYKIKIDTWQDSLKRELQYID